MVYKKSENFFLIIDAISTLDEVQAVGKCGGKELPVSNGSDVDVFVFCDAIPEAGKRKAKMDEIAHVITKTQINAFEGELWGVGDFIYVGDMEICIMYFTIAKTVSYIEAVLNGEHLDKVNNYFYPTGRCATIKNIYILFDRRGFLASMKEKLSVYPAGLAEKMIKRHLSRLENTEDLERAVAREDALFYHFALDISIDHFLQALFALNRSFFPSRKRTTEHMAAFGRLPEDCAGRLLKVVELGGYRDTIRQSYDLWTGLCRDLSDIVRSHKGAGET